MLPDAIPTAVADVATLAPQGPRERLWARGPAVLSDAELVAVLLGTGRAGTSALELARQLIGSGPAARLLTLGPARLARLPGVGPVKAARLVAAIELGRRALASPLQRGQSLTRPAEVAAIYGPRLAGRPEHFVVVYLDARHRVLGEALIGQGGRDRCPVDVREVFTGALEQGAAAILCVHNHPSGELEPSPEDLTLTTRLAEAGRLLGLPLLDHVVVAGTGHLSLRERGWLRDG